MPVVAYQGEPGSYSEQVVWQRFGARDVDPLPCIDYDTVAQAVAARKAHWGVLPWESSVRGPFDEARAAIDAHALVVHERIAIPVRHCVISHEGARLEDIRRAYSQHEVLEECESFLRGHGIEMVPAVDTAAAVRQVAERGDQEEAAIASKRAAALYRMRILTDNIQDERDHRYRFVMVRGP